MSFSQIEPDESLEEAKKQTESDNEGESSSESNIDKGESTRRGLEEPFQVREKKMHGSSLIDIVQKPSVSVKLTSEVSLIDEPQQKEESKQQRLDKKEPNQLNDDWFHTEP